MAFQATQGFARRLGYGLGRGVRFFLYDSNSIVRWTKRLVFIFALLILSTHFFEWLAGTLLTAISMVLIAVAIVKGDFSVVAEIAKSEAADAPYGRDVFGRRFDSWGNVEGEEPDE